MTRININGKAFQKEAFYLDTENKDLPINILHVISSKSIAIEFKKGGIKQEVLLNDPKLKLQKYTKH